YDGKASKEETLEFLSQLERLSDDELGLLLQNKWQHDKGEKEFDGHQLRQRFLENIKMAADAETSVVPMHSRVRRMFRIAAAAVIIMIVAGSIYYFLNSNEPKPVAGKEPVEQKITDVAPAGNRATLTLADGSAILLDSVMNGAISQQAGISIIKNDGQLAYTESENTTEVLYNSIATPRGGQYQLVLSDGTKIWLNAGSYLRYPTSFPGKERRVELKGEGYFEVSHDAEKPFYVTVIVDNGDETEIQVLGTQFNSNNYTDEPSARTTLVEGRVRIKKGENFVYLNPGQQAVIGNVSDQNSIRVDHQADIENALAWKNGLFIFDNSDLNKILRDFSRWYDVEMVIEGNITEKKFFGIVSRNSSLASVMKALKSGSPSTFNYRIDGKKLYVQSASKN
ncbi:MAG TPA: FecR domain-containing protein, partial [Chitinophagaceae bacterium]